MAQLFVIKCPKCGEEFEITKGVLMSWDFSKPIPKELQEETPFNCPKCNHQMSVLDDDFHDHVTKVLCMD
jgi:transcription elongation factor Elf1